MPQYKHILTDFKDLRKVIGEITKETPAKTRYQQQAEKMQYTPEAEAQGIDKDKASSLKKMKDHAGEEEIKKAYIDLGTAAQGSVEFQRKLIQKKLKEMGYNTYSKMAFDTIFNRPLTKEDVDKLFTLTELFSKKQIKKLKSSYKGIATIDPASASGKGLLNKFSSMPKDELLDIAAAGINFLSLLAASQLISRFGMKAGQFKFQKAGDAIVETKTKKKKKKWDEPLKGFPGNEEIDESKMGDLLIDIQSGATAKELTKYHNISLQTAKNFLSDYYSSKRTRKAPGLKKEDIKEGKYLRYSDLLLKKSRLIDKEGPNSNAVKQIDKEIAKEMRKLGIKGVWTKEETIHEGTWAVPDSSKKLADLQKRFLGSKKPASEINARKLAVDLYNIYGDDDFYDELEVYMNNPDPKVDLRDIIIKYLKKWVEIKNYKITKAPENWVSNTTDEDVDIEEIVSEGKPRRGRGNIKKPKGKMIPLRMSREDKLKEEHDHAKQSPFKLKSEQYPRAIAINTNGFGKRHAIVDDIVTACETFGMITDKELQVEQIQKQLGKKGFITYNKSELEDIFEERQTERMILALESDVEEQEPMKYTQGEIAYAELHEHEIEFLKPDGQKAKGPILKMSGSTFNVKDKYTGKSFTYKYSKVIEEERVKTFKEVSQNIQEVSIGPATIRKDFPNVWAQKDNRMNNVLMALVNLHGYIDNLKAYKKDKKGFVDGLRKIGKNDASLKKAGLTKRNIGEDIQEGRFSKQLIKQAGGIAFDKRYYMGNMTGAINAIEKLKKGLSDDPKVQELLRLANESTEPLPTGTATDYTNWLPEGGDKEAYQKFFNAALKKFGVSSPDELEGDKKKEFFDYVDKNWKGDHEEVDIRLDGRKKNFREKMRKLGYIKGT